MCSFLITGSALYIETQAIKRGTDKEGKRKGGGLLKVTGQLGAVMEESTQIAYTVARAKLAEVDPSNSFFDDVDIHMHVPEGATPKDGPSAGVAMATAIISLMTQVPVRKDIAMTGEITLRGRVLPIGGLKEKLLAAARGGITTVFIPEENKKDLSEISDEITKNLKIIPVAKVDEIIEAALVSKLDPIEWSKEDIEAHDQSIAGGTEKERPSVSH